MTRTILGAALALGLALTACENVLAQEHKGWPEDGALHWTPAQTAPANQGTTDSNGGSAGHRGWPADGSLHWTPGQQSASPDAADAGTADHRGWPAEGALNWSQAKIGRPPATDWQYVLHGNRWWYWMPDNTWMYWDHGGWQNYAAAVSVR
jgi:hypothetical protein